MPHKSKLSEVDVKNDRFYNGKGKSKHEINQNFNDCKTGILSTQIKKNRIRNRKICLQISAASSWLWKMLMFATKNYLFVHAIAIKANK